jgi:hypothetical protein
VIRTMITDNDAVNFDILCLAVMSNRTCIIKAFDKEQGKEVMVLCAIVLAPNGMEGVVPLAQVYTDSTENRINRLTPLGKETAPKHLNPNAN